MVGDQDVRGFDVAMDDALLMRVLDGLADLNEKVKPLTGGEVVGVAIFGDFDATHQFHDKERPAVSGGAGIKHFGDVRMIHQGEGLALGFKTGDDLFWCPCRA